ncbi:MAG: hypothetical protein IPL73_23645 [Candidatus Obscuribacter sp.]|nr:hypothetical protein [Candidatus Obscuribacter sp.]
MSLATNDLLGADNYQASALLLAEKQSNTEDRAALTYQSSQLAAIHGDVEKARAICAKL